MVDHVYELVDETADPVVEQALSELYIVLVRLGDVLSKVLPVVAKLVHTL